MGNSREKALVNLGEIRLVYIQVLAVVYVEDFLVCSDLAFEQTNKINKTVISYIRYQDNQKWVAYPPRGLIYLICILFLKSLNYIIQW